MASQRTAAAGLRKRPIVPATLDDFARFGDDAKRQVLLVRLPAQVAKSWKPMFEDGGMEYTRNTGARDIEPKVELGMLLGETAEFKDGATLALRDSTGSYNQYSLSLRPSSGPRMRVISAEVGDFGQNVKFEGEIARTGQLRPTNTDDLYKELLQQRAELNKLRGSELRSITRKEEQAIQEKRSGHVIHAGIIDDTVLDDGEAEEKANNKKGKAGAKGKGKRVAEGAPVKKKVAKKKDKRDLAPEAIKETLYKCFDKIHPETGEKMRYWKMKELRKATGLQQHIMKPILDQICDYNQGGEHHKTYSLKFIGSGGSGPNS